MTAPPDDLESLSTEQLRERAFSRAEHHLDVRFFWTLLKEVPSAQELSFDASDVGQLPAALGDAIGAVREMLGRSRDGEPVLRDICLAYLRQHGADTTGGA